MRQFRFVHIGVAVALSAAVTTAVGIVSQVGATGSSVASSYIPIVPCRLADTRTGTDHVGTRATPLGAGEVVPFTVWGTNGNCVIPATATGIATNVTAVNPSAASYLTIYPADAATRPTASNLNWTATSPPTPNQVTVALSTTGVINAFTNTGTIDLIIDVVGYYEAAGPSGLSAWDTIPSGMTVTGEAYYDGHTPEGAGADDLYIPLPARAPIALTGTQVNMALTSAQDFDATCSGTYNAPTAPSGKVCIYVGNYGGIILAQLSGAAAFGLPKQGFAIWLYPTIPTAGVDEFAYVTWAYTAP